MIEAYTEKQKSLIVNNIVKACDDIEKLNGTGYKFIHLASGFIAHYNIDGFKSNYSIVDCGYSLADAILAHESANKWNNFREGDQNYQYYKSKADIYSRICSKLRNKKLNLYNT
jgi:hypothetical protein